MQFTPSFLDEIRTRLAPSGVIGRRVNLKHQSNGEYSGLCPFHNEKTPSFTVSDDKGFYHCFGCGVHGDIITFSMETQGLSFPEAVSNLAAEAGLEMPKQDAEAEEKYRRISSLYDVTEAACVWFSEQLRLAGGKEALNYLKNRDVNDDTIKTFRLGFAPDNGNSLKDALLAKGCKPEQLVAAGLLIDNKDGKEPYSRFRARVIFPICDVKGRVIAFGGRILGDGQPKYLNSPETEIFHKGSVLYNLHGARQKAYEKKNIAVVEGYMDVIALHKAGISNVVAPLGTAITENHLQMLWRVVDEPVICLDGDKAGKRAMYRTAEKSLPALEPGKSLKFAVLPAGDDPDDVINKYGITNMRNILSNATSLSDVIWEMTAAEKPISTPEQKAAFEQRLMKMVATINNQIVQNYYKNHFWEKLNELKRKNHKKSFNSARKSAAGFRSPALKLAAQINISPKERYEQLLITAIVNHPELLEDAEIEEEFSRMSLLRNDTNEIRSAIIGLFTKDDKMNAEILHKHLENSGFENHIKALSNDMFIETFAKIEADITLAKAGWNYIISYYNLDVMEGEYEKAVETARDQTDETSEKVFELKKQKDMLKKLAEQKKMAYETALDD